MSFATEALMAAAVVNVAVALFGYSWRPNYHQNLADALNPQSNRDRLGQFFNKIVGLAWRLPERTRPIFLALNETAVGVVVALVAFTVSIAVTVAALAFAQVHHDVRITLAGDHAQGLLEIARALFSQMASTRLQEAFLMTGLPHARIRGDAFLPLLYLSLGVSLSRVGLQALGDACFAVWCAIVCTVFKEQAKSAFQVQAGSPRIVRFLLGFPKTGKKPEAKNPIKKPAQQKRS